MRLRKKIKAGLDWAGSRLAAKGGVLLYHRVDDKGHDPFNLCVSPKNFDEQMAVLAQTGKALSLDEFMARRKSGRLESGSVAVTFDDGYLDVFENALPILEKHGIPATVFVATGNLGESFWWDRLAILIHETATLPRVLDLPLDGERIAVGDTGRISRSELFDLFYPIFNRVDPETRQSLFDTLEAIFAHPALPPAPRAATPAEISRAAGHPLVTIGAHTETHSRLVSLDYRNQVREIESSVDRLAGIVGARVNAFSYPFGLRGRDYDEETIGAVAETGIDHAFTADLNVVTSRTRPLAVPRLWVHDRSGRRFRRELQFWLGAPSSASAPVAASAPAESGPGATSRTLEPVAKD
ncbi:MAG: polysaccharide deacetylase family protein [Verrucomicrobiales bacterium]